MQDPDHINDLKPGTRAVPLVQIYLLLLILIGYPVISLLFNHFNPIEPDKIVSKISQVYLPSLAMQLFMLVLMFSVIRRTRGNNDGIGFARTDITWSNILSAIIFFFGAWALLTVIRISVVRTGYLPDKDFMYILPVTITERIVWVLLSLGAALSEEITFRGFAISRLSIYTGWLIAAVLSSAAFSLGHLYQGVAGVFLTFLYGMLFAGLFIARKSVFPCIIAHFLQDVIIVFIVPLSGIK